MSKSSVTMRAIQELEDKLSLFPLGSVIRSHAALVDEAKSAWSERLRMLGNPGRRYWDHPAELMYDEIGTLLGAKFVLLQAGVTETVSIVRRAYELGCRPVSKKHIMVLAADFDKDTGLSLPVIVNAAANFYKHQSEWPKPWNSGAFKPQSETIQQVQLLGMSEQGDLADNLYCAEVAIARNAGDENPADFSRIVIERWRERLAEQLKADFNFDLYCR